MAWPPAWGYLFWHLLHSIAQAFRVHHPDKIPPELAEALYNFICTVCRYLPCPHCRGHCIAYTHQIPPRFTRGDEVHKYLIDFHNAVNTRNNKMVVSPAEADTNLSITLQEFGCTLEKIEEAFLQDWWTVLLLTTFSISMTPDAPKDDEKAEYQKFISNVCMVLPFSFKNSVRTTLVNFVNSESFVLTNRDTAFETITNLHNSVSSEFGVFPKTVKEMKDLFGTRFEVKNYTELVRAHQIREEDHKKMLEMQQKLENATTSDTDSGYKTATIVLSCVLGVIIVIHVYWWWKRKNTRMDKILLSKSYVMDDISSSSEND